MLSRACDTLRREAGVSLLEVIIAMLVFGVVGSVVASSVIQGFESTSLAQSRVEALADLQRGVERVSRELRAACPVRGASATQMTVDVKRGGAVYRYRYTLETATNRLVERSERYDPVTTLWTLLSEGPVVTEVVNTTVFTPYDASGAVAADFRTVTRVGLTLRRRLPAQSPIEVETDVSMRNATRCPQ